MIGFALFRLVLLRLVISSENSQQSEPIRCGTQNLHYMFFRLSGWLLVFTLGSQRLSGKLLLVPSS